MGETGLNTGLRENRQSAGRSPMKLGILLACQFGADVNPAVALEETLEQARLAAEAGFESIWVSHHYLAPFQYFQPVPLLARLAAEVRSVRLGTFIYLLALNRPVDAAEQLANLDVITGGRLSVGVAQGYRQEEFSALGVPISQRGARLKEHIEVVKRLWEGEPVHFHGRFTELTGSVLTLRPLQKPRPPIFVGATTPAGLRRAARCGDGLMLTPETGYIATAERIRIFRESSAEAGRPATLPVILGREACCARTREEAVKVSQPPLTVKYAEYARWGHQVGTVDDLLADAGVIGSPKDCVAQLRRYQEGLGTDSIVLRLQWPGLPHADVLRSIAQFGEHIIPTLQ